MLEGCPGGSPGGSPREPPVESTLTGRVANGQGVTVTPCLLACYKGSNGAKNKTHGVSSNAGSDSGLKNQF